MLLYFVIIACNVFLYKLNVYCQFATESWSLTNNGQPLPSGIRTHGPHVCGLGLYVDHTKAGVHRALFEFSLISATCLILYVLGNICRACKRELEDIDRRCRSFRKKCEKGSNIFVVSFYFLRFYNKIIYIYITRSGIMIFCIINLLILILNINCIYSWYIF